MTDDQAPAPAPVSSSPKPKRPATVDRMTVNGNRVRLDGQLKSIGGSEGDDFNTTIADQAARSNFVASAAKPEDRARLETASLVALAGIAPTSEIEGMLAAQLIATHNAAMECFRRAMIPDQSTDARDRNLGQANKLTRSYATLVQTLDKHRGKGNQTVRVEHVHVHRGGQAVIGNVSAGDRLAAEMSARQIEFDGAPEPCPAGGGEDADHGN